MGINANKSLPGTLIQKIAEQGKINTILWEVSEMMMNDDKFMTVPILQQVVSQGHSINQKRLENFLKGTLYKMEWLEPEVGISVKGASAIAREMMRRITLAFKGKMIVKWLETLSL